MSQSASGSEPSTPGQPHLVLLTAWYQQGMSDWLVETYGLTRVESELTVLLGSGSEISSAARQMRISIHTARKYLQSIFEKAGVRRQVDLVSLLHQRYGGSNLSK